MDDPCQKCQILEKRNLFIRDNCHKLFAVLKDTEGNPLLQQTDFFNTGAEQMKAIFESSTDCILIWDKDYNYLYANQAAIDHVNTTPDKVIGKNIREGLGHIPDFMHLWMSRIDEVFRTGKLMRVEDAVQVGDRLVYSQSVLSPIRYPNGKMFAVGAVYRDVTQQKKAEQEIAMLARFPAEHPDAVLRISEDGSLLYSNKAGDQLLSEWGGGIKQSIPQEWKKLIDKAYSSNKPKRIRIKHDLKTFVFLLVPVTKAGYLNLYAHDITEQKKLEMKLSETEQKYKDLYERAQVPLYRIRIEDGKMLECNDAMVKFGGYNSRDECLTQCFSIVHYVDPARQAELLKQLRNDGFVKGFEIEYIRRDGTHGWIETTAKHYPEEGYIEGAVIDITALKILTKSETEIFELVLQGRSNKEIAKTLCRSVRTIEDHRAHIMQKLHAHNLIELVQQAQSFKSKTKNKKN